MILVTKIVAIIKKTLILNEFWGHNYIYIYIFWESIYIYIYIMNVCNCLHPINNMWLYHWMSVLLLCRHMGKPLSSYSLILSLICSKQIMCQPSHWFLRRRNIFILLQFWPLKAALQALLSLFFIYLLLL